jgi:hypothetical protein
MSWWRTASASVRRRGMNPPSTRRPAYTGGVPLADSTLPAK